MANLRGVATAVGLAAAGLAIAWTCVRVTAGEIAALAPDTPMMLAPRSPDLILGQVSLALAGQRGRLDDATLASVRRAASAAPLDARPYMILGREQLLDGQSVRALASLEAGQRLDPRLRPIHLMLLDLYMRQGRYGDVTRQLSTLARLISDTGIPVAAALATMSLTPETRTAALATLQSDPGLEQSVLVALAKSNIEPDAIFALASPAARAAAGQKGFWGPVLVDRLIDQRRFELARSVWQRLYDVRGDAARSAIFNAGFVHSTALPPFNWTLVSGSLGAAEMKGGALAIDYYGRESGDLASQLLVLAPGRYRFSFGVDPGKSDSASRLAWSLACVGGSEALMTAPIVAAPTARRLSATLVIPAGCPAQLLTVHGEAGEFPVASSVAIRAPAISLDARP